MTPSIYELLVALSPEGLSAKVNEVLTQRKGWLLYGDPIIVPIAPRGSWGTTDFRYAQAIFKPPTLEKPL